MSPVNFAVISFKVQSARSFQLLPSKGQALVDVKSAQNESVRPPIAVMFSIIRWPIFLACSQPPILRACF